MEDHFRRFIEWALGVPTDAATLVDSAAFTAAKRRRWFFRNWHHRAPLPHITQPWANDWGPLLDVNGKPVSLEPLVTVQRRNHTDVCVLSHLAYRPNSLLYHYSTFGGKEAFTRLCHHAGQVQIPHINWDLFLPYSVQAAWASFLALLAKANGADLRLMDQRITVFAPVFSCPYIQLPFRPAEALFCGISEVVRRNLAGNSFHPAVIASILGPPEALRAWLTSDDTPAHHPQPPALLHRSTKSYKTEFSTLCRIQLAGPV